jgi:hypothetical protein
MTTSDTPSSAPDTLEINIGDLQIADVETLDFGAATTLIINIPLDSVGVTNSHIDICDDLVEAIWVGERLAAQAQDVAISEVYPRGYYKPQFRLILSGPKPGLRNALADCAVLHNRFDEDDVDAGARYTAMRDSVLEFEDRLNDFPARLPEIVDDYFANLVGGAYHQMRYDAPDRYEDEIKRFPERRLGYWRSPYSERLGATCYASMEGWLLPSELSIDHFFEVTGQKYLASKFLGAKVLTVNSESFVLVPGMAAYFPMSQYFKSRVCGSLTALDDGEQWPPDAFDWSDASFTYSPDREQMISALPKSMRAPRPRIEGCLVDPDGTVVVVDDGRFQHLLYDTKALTLEGMKTLLEMVGDVSHSLAASVGLASDPRCDWSSLSDESFEQLCYDLIYSHPRFNSETIRKHGKSRSRDGGRDIEVWDIPRGPRLSRKRGLRAALPVQL